MINRHSVEVCVVGMGPAGIGVAVAMEQFLKGKKVLFIDAGRKVNERICSRLRHGKCAEEDPCNIISGFGGCSLLSGGKISLFPAGSSMAKILGSQEAAIEQIEYAKKKWVHLIGEIDESCSDVNTVEQKKFEEMGFEYKYYQVNSFSTRQVKEAYEQLAEKLFDNNILLTACSVKNIERLRSGYRLLCKKDNEELIIEANTVVLAVGKVGRRTLEKVNNGLNLQAKHGHIDIGIRLEFPSEIGAGIFQHHKDLKLKFANARTYCVCQDGQVLSYRLEDTMFTEGHCDVSDKTGKTNLAILCRYPSSGENVGLFTEIKKLLHQSSTGFLISQNLEDFIKRDVSEQVRNSKCSTYILGNLKSCFPEQVLDDIRKNLMFFLQKLFTKDKWKYIKLYGPEVDYNGLVFPIKEDFSVTKGLYVIGAGTGHFRGILQSFCSGLIVGKCLLGGESM